MSHFRLLVCLTLCLIGLAGGRAMAQTPGQFLVEAEDFQFRGAWSVNNDGATSHRAYLITGGGSAFTAVTFKQAGTYHVWGRSRDFSVNQGTRLYQIAIDGNALPNTLGKHGFAGWKWEKAGDATIAASQHMLQLTGLTSFARCDALYFTTGDEDPNDKSLASLGKLSIAPDHLAYKLTSDAVLAPPALTATESGQEVGRVTGKNMRVVFSKAADATGGAHIVWDFFVLDNGNWSKLPLAADGSRIYLIHSPKPAVDLFQPSPRWFETSTLKAHFSVAGREYETATGIGNPFFAGTSELVLPLSARQVDERTVELGCKTTAGSDVVVRWSIAPGANDAKVSVKFQATGSASYSLAFSPFSELGDDKVKDAELPPLFQSKRRAESACLLPNTVMPHALSLVETATASGSPVSLAITAEPAELPWNWPGVDNAVCGFSEIGAGDKWQPTGFMPILGYKNSYLSTGESKTVAFRVAVVPGDWKSGLEYTSTNIDEVTDYRKPWKTSLTNAAFNIIDLMKNDDASGWDPHLKGFWNIESKDTASQSDPLPLISTAVLTHDEDFYLRRALPTIEYTLSRPTAHYATYLVPDSGYLKAEYTKMQVPSTGYGTAYWQSAYALLNDLNPWMAELASTSKDDARGANTHGVPNWCNMLALYRLHPTPELLAKISAEASDWIDKEIVKPRRGDLGFEPFYNVSYYPYWWDLPDLYELTHNRKFLDAAEEGAFGTIAGQWSQPLIPQGDITVNAGGSFNGLKDIWYKGSDKYRLGFPRKPGDTPEHQVPAWLVSRVGLGFEQPVTYYGGGQKGFNNIFNSAWAPNLLRMYDLTGRDIYQTYARNTILSRWANYGGYYISGYTDLPLDPDYPYKGPDVTSIYYHHIPVHLAFTLDYLVTEAHVRSGGKISFPWAKQQGYVWFDNRVYSAQPGSVFDDKTASLWLDRKIARVDSPAVNYITARGHDRFWVVLMNESDKAEQASIVLDANALGLRAGSPYAIFGADGNKVGDGTSATVTVPAKGLVAVAYAAAPRDAYPALPALAGGRTSVDLPGAWGKAEAFRIRSPFGKDSLYVVLTGRPAEGSTATLSVDGAAAITTTQYPYEFTLPWWPMAKDLRFTITVEEPGGKSAVSEGLTLPGTPGH
ncbi:MAG: hypothetical protein P4L33_07275 [Capsulimonadaceae bacterium]|nr:hypothetical protein [Capsulimonadaceae bacterium]